MKHIKRRCPFCHEIFYTEKPQVYFCKPDHRTSYHYRKSNLRCSIQRTEKQLAKLQKRLEQRKTILSIMVNAK